MTKTLTRISVTTAIIGFARGPRFGGFTQLVAYRQSPTSEARQIAPLPPCSCSSSDICRNYKIAIVHVRPRSLPNEYRRSRKPHRQMHRREQCGKCSTDRRTHVQRRRENAAGGTGAEAQRRRQHLADEHHLRHAVTAGLRREGCDDEGDDNGADHRVNR